MKGSVEGNTVAFFVWNGNCLRHLKDDAETPGFHWVKAWAEQQQQVVMPTLNMKRFIYLFIHFLNLNTEILQLFNSISIYRCPSMSVLSYCSYLSFFPQFFLSQHLSFILCFLFPGVGVCGCVWGCGGGSVHPEPICSVCWLVKQQSKGRLTLRHWETGHWSADSKAHSENPPKPVHTHTHTCLQRADSSQNEASAGFGCDECGAIRLFWQIWIRADYLICEIRSFKMPLCMHALAETCTSFAKLCKSITQRKWPKCVCLCVCAFEGKQAGEQDGESRVSWQ